MEIGATAKALGVNNVLISGLVVRKSAMWAERKRTDVNNILKEKCQANNFIYISNNNIGLDDICDDKVHLFESGTVKLANNMINAINRLG